jgi:hypothetical protein
MAGGMSRAAKGADCKSAGYAFAGSSPASPTTVFSKRHLNLSTVWCVIEIINNTIVFIAWTK